MTPTPTPAATYTVSPGGLRELLREERPRHIMLKTHIGFVTVTRAALLRSLRADLIGPDMPNLVVQAHRLAGGLYLTLTPTPLTRWHLDNNS